MAILKFASHLCCYIKWIFIVHILILLQHLAFPFLKILSFLNFQYKIHFYFFWFLFLSFFLKSWYSQDYVLGPFLCFIHPPLWFLSPSLYKGPFLQIISSFVLVNAAVLPSFLSRNFWSHSPILSFPTFLLAASAFLVFPNFVSFSLPLLLSSRL